MSPDGSMERLTPEVCTVIRLVFLTAGLVLAALVIWGLAAPENRKRFFTSLISLPGKCVHDARPFADDLFRAVKSGNRFEGWAFLGIFAAGILIRLLRIGSPLMHDEAYSMAIWGRSDLLFAVSDYHLPNNHVFHSVLVNLIYHLLGKTVPLLRLPVFISGCLLIPAVWLLGRLFYRGAVPLIACGLTAFAPFLIFYSVNARGYEIQAFLSVITIGLAVYGKRKKNIFSWFLLIIFSVLNFFTLPIALYPFGGICIWLFLNVVFFGKENTVWRSRLQLLKYLLFMGVCVSVLSILIYVPLLHYSGWNSFFGNIYIGGTESSTFDQTMISRLKDNVLAFTETWPFPVIWVIAAGLILSLLFFRKNSREKISAGLSVLLWMGLVIPFQKPNLWPRTLLFLHPLLLLFAASGLYGLCSLLPGKRTGALICAAVILAAAVSQFRLPEGPGPDERAVRLIIDREGANAANIHFVTAAQDNAPLWIYADSYGLPRKIFDKRESFNTVYAFVNPLNDSYQGPKTLPDLLSRFGPGDVFIDFGSGEILMDEPDAVLYRFNGKTDTIRKAYGDCPEIPENLDPAD